MTPFKILAEADRNTMHICNSECIYHHHVSHHDVNSGPRRHFGARQQNLPAKTMLKATADMSAASHQR